MIGHHTVRNNHEVFCGEYPDYLRRDPRGRMVVFEVSAPSIATNRQEIEMQTDIGESGRARRAIGHARGTFKSWACDPGESERSAGLKTRRYT